MARTLFSQSWHAVAELKPRLLPGARVHRHVYRGQVWYVVQDQGGGRIHRFSAQAHALIRRMDGRTSVQALWDEACRAGGDDIPTQNEVVDLLIQLHAADLLQTDMTPDAAALFERYRKRRDQTWKQWLMNPMALKLPPRSKSKLSTITAAAFRRVRSSTSSTKYKRSKPNSAPP